MSNPIDVPNRAHKLLIVVGHQRMYTPNRGLKETYEH